MNKRHYLAAAYLLILHLLVGALLVKVEAVPKVVNRIGMSTVRDSAAAMVRNHPGVILPGDSHTYLLGDFPENQGASGSKTAGLIKALPDMAGLPDARAVLLMIGPNDVWTGQTAGLSDRFRAIAAALPAGMPVVWSAIPPADDFRIDPADVRDANRAIEALCAARPRCTYVDTWKLLADADGRPVPGYFVADRVHMSADGYRVWLGALVASLDALNPEGSP